MTPDLICLGEPLVEFVDVGGSGEASYRCGLGGDTSNAAIAAARQGGRVGYLSVLGSDRFGDRIMAGWIREGIDTTHVRRNPDAPTGIYFVHPDPVGREFSYFRAGSAASRMMAEDLPLDYLREARALHLSGISLAVSESMRKAALTAARTVKEAGGTVSLDTNLRLKLWTADIARTEILGAMSLVGIVITSIEDSRVLTGLDEAGKIIDFYQQFGPKIVIVTQGDAGCTVDDGNTRTVIDAAAAEAVDSTGAGDSFAGAFLARWLATSDVIGSAEYAAFVAAKVVSGYGAVDPIPMAEAVLSEMGVRPG
ncbi:MAG: sugar kinase [Pseudomonadota bacterium]